MRRFVPIVIVLCVLLALVSPSRAMAQAQQLPSAAAGQSTGRLVLFEAFMRAA